MAARPFRLLAALAASAALHASATPVNAGSASSRPDCREVWIDLSLPELASVPAPQRAEARRRIVLQQDEVMQRLRDLGAVETARVQLVRNALAVCIPEAGLAQAREIPGVRGVSPVRHHRFQRNP